MIANVMNCASAKGEVDRSGSDRLCVLIVDDEAPVRNVLASYLQKFDYRPLEAANALDAYRTLETENVDIVISDNQMPGMSGVQLYRRIEKDFPELTDRFLLITGTKHDEEVALFVRETSASFLEKPFQLKEISRILDDMVARIERPTHVS